MKHMDGTQCVEQARTSLFEMYKASPVHGAAATVASMSFFDGIGRQLIVALLITACTTLLSTGIKWLLAKLTTKK